VELVLQAVLAVSVGALAVVVPFLEMGPETVAEIGININ
jgi:hypothetical protein